MVRDLELRVMRESERPGFLALMEAAFDETFMFGRYLDCDPNLGADDTLVALDADRIVSAVQIITRTIRLRGEEVRLGGIGSVATHPEYERRGISTRLLGGAIEEMKGRGMALSLLFTGRSSFYERLDWVMVPCPVCVLRGGDPLPGDDIGLFGPEDLDEVRALYARYCERVDLSTLRDEAYWRGQLAFAGNPDEEFYVVRRDGRIRAYARRIEFMGLTRIIEYARDETGAADLARLLLWLAPDDAPLFVPDAADAELRTRLEVDAGQVEQVTFPDQMWRVLDRGALAALDDEGGAGDDAALLARLVGRPGALFWPSDRF